jgi:hypothetical protein
MAANWDVFISHASEDKSTVARPLTELLQRAGLRVWLDEDELTLGDSLSRKIDEGLAHSAYGVVILSKYFFQKDWPAQELAGLTARQVGGRKVILPVWHGVDKAFILSYSPTLADALGITTEKGLEKVAEAIFRAVRSGEIVPTLTKSKTKPSRKHWIIFIACAAVLISLCIGFLYWNAARREASRIPKDDDVGRALFWRMNHARISGYFSISCNTCQRPRAWAFYVSPSKDGTPLDPPELLESMRSKTSWPITEFLYPDDKPGVGYCVDFPKGACQGYPSIWKPRHELSKRALGPVLRLDLQLVISGFELHVANEGEALAQGINVDVTAWQAGAPGAEVIKSYPVRDLSPLADYTIQSVFGSYNERIPP